MATKSFSLNTTPHVADIGGTQLSFQPEMMGDEFVEAYAELRESRKGLDREDADPEAVRVANRAMRTFLARTMLPESAELFTRLDVVSGGEILKSFHDLAAAREFAAAEADSVAGDLRVVDGLPLPDRILVELIEWVSELYGGGTRPTGSSTGSATASPRAGKPGTAASRSRGSTRARGR